MHSPTIKKFFAGLFSHLPGVMLTNFVDSKSDSSVAATAMRSRVDSPFVLVAHGAGGQWDVFAEDFEHPLASFGERQAGCEFANHLAKTRNNSIVLIREFQERQHQSLRPLP